MRRCTAFWVILTLVLVSTSAVNAQVRRGRKAKSEPIPLPEESEENEEPILQDSPFLPPPLPPPPPPPPPPETRELIRVEPWSLLGGRTLDQDRTAMRIEIGWPEISLAVHIPVHENVEIIPHMGFFFGLPIVGAAVTDSSGEAQATSCCGAGNSAGVAVRWLVHTRRVFSLGMQFDIAPLAKYDMDALPGLDFGVRVGVGLIFDYVLHDGMNLVGGMEIPLDIYFSTPTTLILPIKMRVGVESFISEDSGFFAVVEISPGIFVRYAQDNVAGFGAMGRVGGMFRF